MYKFYTIAQDRGGKYISYDGYIDKNPASKSAYQLIDGCVCDIYLEDIPASIPIEKYIYSKFEEVKKDIWLLDANDFIEEITSRGGSYLPLNKVTVKTACGNYWC